MSDVLEVRARASYNADCFLINDAYAFHAYHRIHENFKDLGSPLTLHRNAAGKSLVSFIPFILLMQRQGMNAFWKMASFQSYEAWVLLRPCVEAALILGKWTDDPENAEIWRNREQNRTKYRNRYEGQALISTSLPRSVDLRGVLTRINSDFMHFNNLYYQRHLEQQKRVEGKVDLLVHYFEDDDPAREANVLAFLHLMFVIQNSLAQLFASEFPSWSKPDMSLGTFENQHGQRVQDLAKNHPETVSILSDLGLWSVGGKQSV